jgi:hypothetical protein
LVDEFRQGAECALPGFGPSSLGSQVLDGVKPSEGLVEVRDFLGDSVANGFFGFPVAAEVRSKCYG